MSSCSVLTKYPKSHRMFTWKIINVNKMKLSDFKESKYSPGRYELKSPEMKAIDPYTGFEYKVTLEISNSSEKMPFDHFFVYREQNCNSDNFVGFYQINDSELVQGIYIRGLKKNTKTLSIFLYLPIKSNQSISPPIGISSCSVVTQFGQNFSWKIPDMDQKKISDFKASKLITGNGSLFEMESPEMKAIDPFDESENTITILLCNSSGAPPFNYFDIYLSKNGTPYFRPTPFECSYQINDSELQHGDHITGLNEETKTLSIFLYLPGKLNRVLSSPKISPFHTLENRLKEIWKNDSSNKFTIKCANGTSIETFKPFLAAASPVFAQMFESSNFIESLESCIEITDFVVEVVQKMVEFCETDDIKDSEGHETKLYAIADKYDMQDLVKFIIKKMIENVSSHNFDDYLQHANFYDLNEFKEWLLTMGFCK